MVEGSEQFKKTGVTLILIALIVVSYFLLKPLLTSIILGAILGFMFLPLYKRLNKLIKSRDVSATLICLLFVVIVLVPLYFLTPMLLNQSINIFMEAQHVDFVTPFKKIFPALFVSPQFSNEIGSILSSFVNKLTSSIMGEFSKLILNLPIIALQLLVVFFVFYFVMRDHDELIEYIQSILPFPKETEQKLFKSSKDMTSSVLYGIIILGIIQGIIVGVGYFIFNVPNALFLTILTVMAGIFPIAGVAFVWIPVAIYLLIVNASLLSILGVCFFGIFAIILEHILKPLFISKRTNVHSAIIVIGMVGGIFLFGVLGVVIGPLILSYLLIILEIFKNKKT